MPASSVAASPLLGPFIAISVRATAPGFLLLADEYFPGWSATVNGAARPIVPANHTFRLVEVPAGTSEVVFTYRPRSVLIGAVITLLAVIAFVVLWRWSLGFA